MKQLLKRVLVTSVLVLATMMLISETDEQTGTLYARSGLCSCAGTAYGHQYGGSYVGSDGSAGIFPYGTANDNVQCATQLCQNWIWSVGSAVCDTYGLNGGVGYVLLDWYWFFNGGSDHYVQPYDCDDL